MDGPKFVLVSLHRLNFFRGVIEFPKRVKEQEPARKLISSQNAHYFNVTFRRVVLYTKTCAAACCAKRRDIQVRCTYEI